MFSCLFFFTSDFCWIDPFHKWKSLSHVQLWQPHGLYNPWNSPGQNTGEGSLSLLQGIFQTQGLNTGLPHCRQIIYHLSYKGSPRILEWVAYPFSSRSFRPRNETVVSCIAGGFYTNWAIRKDLPIYPFLWLRSFTRYICLTGYYIHNFRDTFNFIFLYYSKSYSSDSVFCPSNTKLKIRMQSIFLFLLFPKLLTGYGILQSWLQHLHPSDSVAM